MVNSVVEPQVASCPADHSYVRHILPRATVVPQSRIGIDESESFWEPRRLARRGVRIAHLHFGFETRSIAQLSEWFDECERADVKVVYTAHDLVNPHLTDQTHFRHLESVIVRRSSAVITITPTAGRTLLRRYGRTCSLIPHPHVHPLPLPVRTDSRSGAFIHLGRFRPNLDIRAIRAAVRSLGDTGRTAAAHVVDVDLERLTGAAAELVHELSRSDHVLLSTGPRLTDQELFERLSASEVTLLPYRWGTHSGMIEAAIDCGSRPVARDVGGYKDQGASTYRRLRGIADALRRDDSLPNPVDREQQREQIASAHQLVYRGVCGS